MSISTRHEIWSNASSARIKQFRRIATRYDKRSERFSLFVVLAAAFIWIG
jgi:transposase